MRTRMFRTILGAALFVPALAIAQNTTPAPAPAQPAQPAVVTPALDFSGVVYGNYQYHTDSASKASNGNTNPNAFNLDRVYLTFKMPVGDAAQVRVTTDLYQNTAPGTYYKGWAIRLKYAWLQYNFLKNAMGNGSSAFTRLGITPNVVIDHEESFWPRWLGTTVTDRLGWFPSADLGVAGGLTLPSKMGEVYATVTNGTGYAAPETDRFKDFAVRASLTPFSSDAGLLKTFTVSPWVYVGHTASKFANGGAGQVGPITDALPRTRYGVLAGIKDHSLTAAVHYTQRKDASETGANTLASPRAEFDSTGSALSAYTVIRPGDWMTGKKTSWGLVGRWDRYTPNTSPSAPAYNGSTPDYSYYVLGAFWEPTARTSLSLDYQAQSPNSYPSGFAGMQPKNSSLFVHWAASF